MSWDAILAICTGALALFTATMAWFTRKSIVESHAQYERTRAQSEEHHQNSFRPIVVMLPFDGIESADRSSVIKIDLTRRMRGMHVCAVHCVLQNVGVGPALNVRLHFRAMGKPGYGFTKELMPVGAGETRDDPNHRFRFFIQPTPDFNETDIASASDTGWELVLQYEDVFGNPFYTIHRKSPLTPWTECGKGRAPPA